MKHPYLKKAYDTLLLRTPHEPEFHQAVYEVLESLEHVVDDYPYVIKENIIERLLEPERVITFRVSWTNDQGDVEVNRGYRVQFNSAIGTFKGGLRFHPSVNLSILKFLAFEQTFKNALTTLPMGGAKGGSDFNPKGRSDQEIMRFCQAFMSELYHHIGEDIDVPAGDIGVGRREIGYLYGYYKKLKNQVSSVLTGKGTSYGGSYVRKEATGYGLVYFTNEALKTVYATDFKDKKVIISGSGNVAIYAAEKVIDLGGLVIGMSDSEGIIHDATGIDIKIIKEIKEIKRENIKAYLDTYPNATYQKNPKKLWEIICDVALPCATQNELDDKDVKHLIKNNVLMVSEGANMPLTKEAIDLLLENNILFGPAKAANAGGVLVSGLEISQNNQFYNYSYEKVDTILKDIMNKMFHDIYETARRYNEPNNLLCGANILSFKKIAKAMHEQGVT